MRSLQTFAAPIWPRAAAVAVICTLAGIPSARADAPSGHEIAERFAADSERAARNAAERAELQRQQRIEAEQKRNEADMLARARSEAAAREAVEAEMRRKAENIQRVIEAERQANARRLDEERQAKERAAQAAAADERRRQEAAKLAEGERVKAAAEAARLADLAKQRAAEAERISQALREAREAHERRQKSRDDEARLATEQAAKPVESRPADHAVAPNSVAATTYGAGDDAGSRFTVLIVMAPGDKGIRRHNKTADPVLCMDQGCYISNGSDSAASLMPQRKALGIGRTLGARAGACHNSLGCAFRGVDFAGFPNYVQPIDMRVVKHDRREAQSVAGGSDCELAAGQLHCRKPVRSHDYVMWLVPETMAAAAGAAVLERALADGLAESDVGAPQRAALR